MQWTVEQNANVEKSLGPQLRRHCVISSLKQCSEGKPQGLKDYYTHPTDFL
jgi:hypothetical protein